MISATPALSSAPSSVSPLEVTMSWPSLPASSGIVAGSSTVSLRGSSIGPPAYARWTIGSTPSPGASGLVSTWARSPTTGVAPLRSPGSVAIT